MTTTKRPTHSIKRGTLEAAIWTNETKEGRAFYRVTFSRSYRKKDGTYENSNSFGSRNLGELAALAMEAEKWVLEHETVDPEIESVADAE